MHPVFFTAFGFEVHFYSVFFTLGLIAGCLIFVFGDKRLRKNYKDPMLDAYLYILIAIMIGAKLMYVLVNFKTYANDFSQIISGFRNGFLFYGGVIGSIFAMILFFRKKDLPVWYFVDAAAPAIPLGHAIGRIGCLFAGCCYGSPTELPWGIIYPVSCPIAPSGVALHPYPIYEMIGNLIIFAIIMSVRYKSKVPGRMMGIYLMGYGLLRFGLEFTRGDYVQMIGIFSEQQIISLIMFAIGLAGYFLLGKMKQRDLSEYPLPVTVPKKPKKKKK
ncbi:MAG: prolipoprotein diacylglyceryl transferase [Eubacteriales bacterium]